MRVAPRNGVAWRGRRTVEELGLAAVPPKPPRPRGRPPIHLSASLNLLLPSQLYPRSTPYPEAERRLMLAVLEDAIGIFLRHRRAASARDCRLFAETAQWIASDDDESPFSFLGVCEVLGLEPVGLRHGLARCRRMGRERERQ
jgi:hypothetical protein